MHRTISPAASSLSLGQGSSACANSEGPLPNAQAQTYVKTAYCLLYLMGCDIFSVPRLLAGPNMSSSTKAGRCPLDQTGRKAPGSPSRQIRQDSSGRVGRQGHCATKPQVTLLVFISSSIFYHGWQKTIKTPLKLLGAQRSSRNTPWAGKTRASHQSLP